MWLCEYLRLASGHGFNRATSVANTNRLQPLGSILRVLTQTLRIRGVYEGAEDESNLRASA